MSNQLIRSDTKVRVIWNRKGLIMLNQYLYIPQALDPSVGSVRRKLVFFPSLKQTLFFLLKLSNLDLIWMSPLPLFPPSFSFFIPFLSVIYFSFLCIYLFFVFSGTDDRFKTFRWALVTTCPTWEKPNRRSSRPQKRALDGTARRLHVSGKPTVFASCSRPFSVIFNHHVPYRQDP